MSLLLEVRSFVFCHRFNPLDFKIPGIVFLYAKSEYNKTLKK